MLCPHYKQAVDKCDMKKKMKELGTAYINPLVAGETTGIPIT